MSDLYRDRVRRAAKDHKCEECRLPIAKGTEYLYASGVCDGSGWSAKLCLRCKDVHGRACKYARYDSDESPRIGLLAEWLMDSFGDAIDQRSLKHADIIEAGDKILTALLAKGKRAP